MTQSMTGFGKAEGQIGPRVFAIEIRTLNSKQLDLNVRMPGFLREREMVVRKQATVAIGRGKAELFVGYESVGMDGAPQIDAGRVAHYVGQLRDIAQANDQAADELLPAVLRLPDVVSPVREALDDDGWASFHALVAEALEQLEAFRAKEGATLAEDLRIQIAAITELEALLDEPIAARIDRLRARIKDNLASVIDPSAIDNNRLEQELIYYIEKLDVHEERVRLHAHLEHFLEVLDAPGTKGKKLGFIAQEIGREVNTLGSKANDAGMQHTVVEMKDALEKIKEQVLNVK
jgi:uncharacterized protein (TIGR00255 family)